MTGEHKQACGSVTPGKPNRSRPFAGALCIPLYLEVATRYHRCLEMQVTSEILGYGSCGTIVFSGTLDGRQVAVKRILRQFNELAHKEIAALIVSDEVLRIHQASGGLSESSFIPAKRMPAAADRVHVLHLSNVFAP